MEKSGFEEILEQLNRIVGVQDLAWGRVSADPGPPQLRYFQDNHCRPLASDAGIYMLAAVVMEVRVKTETSRAVSPGRSEFIRYAEFQDQILALTHPRESHELLRILLDWEALLFVAGPGPRYFRAATPSGIGIRVEFWAEENTCFNALLGGIRGRDLEGGIHQTTTYNSAFPTSTNQSQTPVQPEGIHSVF